MCYFIALISYLFIVKLLNSIKVFKTKLYYKENLTQIKTQIKTQRRTRVPKAYFHIIIKQI